MVRLLSVHDTLVADHLLSATIIVADGLMVGQAADVLTDSDCTNPVLLEEDFVIGLNGAADVPTEGRWPFCVALIE